MNTACVRLSWLLSWSMAAGMTAGGAAAQESTIPTPAAAPAAAAPGASGANAPSKAAPKSTAQIDAGEPRADTSAVTPSRSDPAPAPTQRSPLRSSAARTPGTATSSDAPGPPGGAGQKAPRAADRLDLGTATVTGDREQPKVMYIVPWKRSDIGDQSGKPMNSLLDEALAPVDREEFKREVAYYDAVRVDAPQNGASKATAKQGEK